MPAIVGTKLILATVPSDAVVVLGAVGSVTVRARRSISTCTVFVVAIATMLNCNRAQSSGPVEKSQAAALPALAVAPAPPPPVVRRAPSISAADALPGLSDLPPERRAIQIVDGERQVDADAARAR